MSTLLIALPALLLLTGGGLLALAPAHSRTTAYGTGLRARPGTRVRRAGLALGAVLACWTALSGSLGSGLMLAPTAFGACAVLGALGADALTPRQRGTVRTAGLTHRRVRDYLPTRLAAVSAAFAAVLAALLVATTATGGADDLGRAGRSFARVCGDVSMTRGPWPGSFYSVPLLAALGIATALCGLAVHRMARRPAPGGPGAHAADEARRREGTTAVTAAWGLLVTGSLAGVGVFTAGALRGIPCASTATQAAWWALLPTVAGAAVTAVYCLAVLCAVGGRRP
ncbi:hypothetical protein [Streptomyces sp. NPDC049879]|uniref:hypothetical protein n=1 Tax=Streptomyces sp. NPDC049879 TaxID=3365598 RepID=UPI0037A3DCEF